MVSNPKSVTIDFRKPKYEKLYEAVEQESGLHNSKLSPTIMAMLQELLDYRIKDTKLFIKDARNNIVAPL